MIMPVLLRGTPPTTPKPTVTPKPVTTAVAPKPTPATTPGTVASVSMQQVPSTTLKEATQADNRAKMLQVAGAVVALFLLFSLLDKKGR